MKYNVISADCHIDLIWLPPDLFTSNASAAMKERMPYVTDGERGKEWVTKSGASFGLMNGMGSAGRLYEPGRIHRSDRMASEGVYDDGKKGIRRMTDPDSSQGSGPRRHPGRGVVRHSRRHQPDQRRRSRRRDAAHLQRVAGAILHTNIAIGTIGEYTTSGATVNASLITGLNDPDGIAVSGGNLFVANFHRTRLANTPPRGRR